MTTIKIQHIEALDRFNVTIGGVTIHCTEIMDHTDENCFYLSKDFETVGYIEYTSKTTIKYYACEVSYRCESVTKIKPVH